MQARVIFSLGATNPAPPSTCRGTMVKVVAAMPPVKINWRREGFAAQKGCLSRRCSWTLDLWFP